jgi:putative SOS response-associated peptidase YedK
MPVILAPNLERHWLEDWRSASDLLSDLQPYAADLMEAYQVTHAVNVPSNDSSDLLRPAA